LPNSSPQGDKQKVQDPFPP